MLKKSSIIIALLAITASALVFSCGGKSSSAGAVNFPEVSVVSGGENAGTTTGDITTGDTTTGDTTTGGSTTGGSTTGGSTTGGSTTGGSTTGGSTIGGSTTGGSTTGGGDNMIVVVKVDETTGKIWINGEGLSPAAYETPGAISIKDEHGTTITATFDNSGNIKITPDDGTVAGTYTVIITSGGREYLLIIQVSADETAVVTTSISYPIGSSMVLDLEGGKVRTDIDGNGTIDDFMTFSSVKSPSSEYTLDSSISSFSVKDSSGNTITASIDPVTGDLITGSGTGPYIITIVKTDGTIITIYTDSNGKITNIPLNGMCHILLPVVNGIVVIVPETTISGINIEAFIPVSEKTAGVWTQLSTITSIKAFTGTNDAISLEVKIDPLTGAVITPGLTFTDTKVVIEQVTADSKVIHTILLNAEGKITSYIKVEVKNDGTKITTIILFDENGNIKVYEEKIIKPNGETTTTTIVVNNGIPTVTVTNVGIMLRLDSGSVSSNGFVLALTQISDGLWTIKSNVEILSGMAADGSFSIDISKITVDPVTGYLQINGDGTIVPAGPYEIKVRIDGKIYIIKSDVNGNIETILPGSILLQTALGYITYNDRDVLKIAEKINGSWSFIIRITPITATDSSGNSVAVSIDPFKGYIITSDLITGPVTLSFVYTDSKGNGITYTVVVINGSVYSYTAEITNPSPDFDFSTVTNIKVFLSVVDNKTGLPVKQASINLQNATAENSWKGFTDNDGKSVFTATVASASQTTSINVSHAGYLNVESPINGIGKLIEIGKKIAMTPETVVVPPSDSDNDGVPDSDDNYPNDPTGAKKITGVYTFAFEDQYTYNSSSFNMPNTSGNDADFNDLVVCLTITEKIDSQNNVREVELKTKLLAASAGCSDSFGIYVNGVRYILISDPKADPALNGNTTLGSNFNARTTDSYVNCVEKITTIKFAEGVVRNTLSPMPYDPFMIPGGGTVGTTGPNEVHLASVSTSYTGVRTGNGYIKGYVDGIYNSRAPIKGFVWAIMLPENWQWPYESTCIGIAYPHFIDWCNSGGTLYTDWYNHPDLTKVFNR